MESLVVHNERTIVRSLPGASTALWQDIAFSIALVIGAMAVALLI
jgi:hypothetical protein